MRQCAAESVANPVRPARVRNAPANMQDSVVMMTTGSRTVDQSQTNDPFKRDMFAVYCGVIVLVSVLSFVYEHRQFNLLEPIITGNNQLKITF